MSYLKLSMSQAKFVDPSFLPLPLRLTPWRMQDGAELADRREQEVTHLAAGPLSGLNPPKLPNVVKRERQPKTFRLSDLLVRGPCFPTRPRSALTDSVGRYSYYDE